MDRSPFYSDLRDPRASASRPAAARGDEEARRGMDRLPPVLPSSHSLPKLPVGRSEALAPLGPARLPPIKDSDIPPYAAQRSYPPMADRPAFGTARRTSPPSSSPAGMVSADYMHPTRSPGESVASPYPPALLRHPDLYRQDVAPVHPSSRMPHLVHYDLAPAHLRHGPEIEPPASGTPIKRPRVSLACLACRNRKSRCDGVRPTCKTCANMKIECKWPEVDFRRAKTGDAARARKRSPGEPSSRTSPESTEQKPRGIAEPIPDLYGRPSSGLPPSQSMPVLAVLPGSSSNPQTTSLASSPTSGRLNRYRTQSDGDHDPQYAQSSFQPHRSPSERHVLPPIHQERHPSSYGRLAAHERPYSSSGLPFSRYEPRARLTKDDDAGSFAQDRYATYESQAVRPIRPLPEPRTYRPSAAAMRCKRRAATIAVLARPATDPHRAFVESQMKRESSLEDLADRSTAGERLDRAFAADWDAIGGLSSQTRRPFMDVAAGIIGILEVYGSEAQRGDARQPSGPSARLHVFRLRNGQDAQPDLRHISVMIDLAPQEERSLLEATSATYDALSYPIPVDRLSQPLVESMRLALPGEEAGEERISESAPSSRSPIRTPSLPSTDAIPFAQREDVKPPQHVVQVFFEAFTKTIGDQVPGLDTKIIGARIKDDSISALMANALCGIGASLYERAGHRVPIAEAKTSNVYVDRARALIGAALQTPDLEAIVALGVIAICDMLMGQMISAAAIVSSAVSLCKQLDLHRVRAEPQSRASMVSDLATGQSGRITRLDGDDVFWMIYCLDRVTSIVTARPLAIKDRDIDTAFPSSMRDGEPCIFAALVRQLHYLGRLSELDPSGGQESDRARALEIAAIGADLIGHYNSLPAMIQLGSANLRRAHERRELLSFLQLHLAHNVALIHLSLVSQATSSEADFDKMRIAAREVVEICMLGEALDPTLLADTPLSSLACFLAGCVTLSEIEVLEESMQTVSSPDSSARSIATQLDSVQADLARLMETMDEHAKFWPVAKRLVGILGTQKNKSSTANVSSATLSALASQVEAIHVLVRRPEQDAGRIADAATRVPVEVRKVTDLGALRASFQHLC